jgi:hypothetical protein
VAAIVAGAEVGEEVGAAGVLAPPQAASASTQADKAKKVNAFVRFMFLKIPFRFVVTDVTRD